MAAITGKCIVELEPGVWIAPGKGDPSRTTDKANAEIFETWKEGLRQLGFARHWRPFRRARVVPIDRPAPAGAKETEDASL